MDFSGLVGGFPTNRPLTDLDRRYQLRQSVRLDIDPTDQLAVIRMNSTFLETVDKWHGWRGFATAFAITVLLIFYPKFVSRAFEYIQELLGTAPTQQSTGFLLNGLFFIAVLLTLIGGSMLWILRKECFAYTHYPIRFNRKTGIVHYFRTNGEIRSVPWRDVFFTVVNSSRAWGLRGHVLADDQVTVVDTFGVGPSGSILSHDADPTTGQYEFTDSVRAHWEFIRRYMEEGPEQANQIVKFCMPVADRKETPGTAFHRVFANFAGDNIISLIVISPFCFWVILGRLFATVTNKIPQWPAEIESACAIEPNDLYAIRGDAHCHRVPDTAADARKVT